MQHLKGSNATGGFHLWESTSCSNTLPYDNYVGCYCSDVPRIAMGLSLYNYDISVSVVNITELFYNSNCL